LESLLFFRVLQGAGGGGLQPSEQGILLDTFPQEKRGMAMAIYGVAVLLAPIMGPTLGGYITENFNWRWIFYINIPVGILSLFLTNMFVSDPPWMEEQRKSQKIKTSDLDWFGLGLIALGLGALEIIYDRGQIDDWFNSQFIIILTIVTILSLSTAIIWELHHPRPIVNLRFLADRNFVVCCGVMCVAFAAIYGSNVLLPQL
jgi:DHA2 family multidrug resistance protein